MSTPLERPITRTAAESIDRQEYERRGVDLAERMRTLGMKVPDVARVTGLRQKDVIAVKRGEWNEGNPWHSQRILVLVWTAVWMRESGISVDDVVSATNLLLTLGYEIHGSGRVADCEWNAAWFRKEDLVGFVGP
jgi:hypothetical protein